jgi:glycosyltransferase involved in cell wall biosynthesis/2-polyprenyl-3-methyl-5-hydroxy-6-metoxy-1,4-benzoquinol methylase
MNDNPSCWCGNQQFQPFSEFYRQCASCGTLVSAHLARVIRSQENFYGHDYWFGHQTEELLQPDIIQRARQDLTQRCLHWLRTVLKYKLPPGRTLELGSGHGAFVAILRSVGYEAVGLELSPWVVEFARTTFQIPMLLGPLEKQGEIEAQSLDLVILMDVLEHLPSPLETVSRCLDLLKPDGLLVIQTPCLPEGKTYDDLVSQGDRFTEMMVETEHLFLFSRSSIQQFFARAGFSHLQFEPAIFAHYDMSLVVGHGPLHPHSSEEIEAILSGSPRGRIVRALLDLDQEKQAILQRYSESEIDRAARLDQIHELTRLARNMETDLASSREEINRLCRRLEEKLDQVGQLNRRLQESEELIRRLAPIQKVVETFYGPRLKKILRATGLLGLLKRKVLGIPSGQNPLKEETTTRKGGTVLKPGVKNSISCLAIDLTPLLPGVENGGAKLLALELVRYLSMLLRECKFVLLTSDRSHEELACLDAPNVQRRCIKHHKCGSVPANLSRKARLKVRFREWLAVSLPTPVLAKLKTVYRSLGSLPSRPSGVLRELQADLLFCPFTMPFYHDPAIPTVSIVYDLQYHYYPQFFSSEDRLAREYHFKETCRLADRLICISEYVRGTVLENSSLSPEHVVSIPIRLLGRLNSPGQDSILTALTKHGLEKEEFLLYPANFWAHKNHSMLLAAFGMFRARHPESNLRLVCTGSPDGRMEDLREASRRMGLASKVLFPGFLPDPEFAALLASCRALIFPSLYEGFGMPVLEAMVFGKPVLCSNLTSLPEVAGDAALLFDPKKPQEILAAMERILQDDSLVTRLVARGYDRASAWGDAEQMAREYANIFFQAAVRGDRRISMGLHGIYSDGWTQGKVIVAYDACPDPRFLEMVFELPAAQPHRRISLRVSDEETPHRTYFLTREYSVSLRHPLSEKGGFVTILFTPTFQPKECGMNEDQRWLGCILRECAIIHGAKRDNLLEKSNLSCP